MGAYPLCAAKAHRLYAIPGQKAAQLIGAVPVGLDVVLLDLLGLLDGHHLRGLARSGGSCILAGYAQPVGAEEVDFYSQVVKKHLTIQGVWVSDTRHTRQAMELVLEQPERFAKLITHRFPLEEANRALEAMQKKEALKAVLTFESRRQEK